MIKKILIVGSEKVFAIENYYFRYLQELGVTVTRLPAFNIFVDYYFKNVLNKVIFRLGLSDIYPKINRLFKSRLKTDDPDIILVFKGMELFPSSLKFAREKNIPLVNYNPDNPFIFSGSGSGNSNVTRSISLYDLHLTYDRDIRRQLIEEYKCKAELLPFAFENNEELFNDCTKQDEILRVCFVGNPDTNRIELLMQLANAGLPLDVYGFGWERHLSHSNIALFPAVLGDETWKTLYKYRVQLNIMRIHNLNSHNMRSFEVPGIGGIMLAPDTPDHRDFFVAGEEIFVYRTAEDCMQTATQLLNLDKQAADRIRTRARLRSITSGYSYQARAKQLLNYLSKINSPV